MDLSRDTVPLIKKEYACHNIFKTTLQKRESQYETKVDPERGSVKEGEEEEEEVEWDGVGGVSTWSLLIPPRHLSPTMLLHSLVAGEYPLSTAPPCYSTH